MRRLIMKDLIEWKNRKKQETAYFKGSPAIRKNIYFESVWKRKLRRYCLF
jgi:hypothetical protein